MNNLIEKMNTLINLQKEVLFELESINIIDINNTSNKIDLEQLENIEKYYFMLDTINKNIYNILYLSKKQKDDLEQYSKKIRTNIKKEINILNDNKFINVLESHFNGLTNEMQLNPEKHRNIYDSIQEYHKLHSNNKNYILEKSIQLANQTINIPVVDTLEEIPPMFCWWAGDSKHKAGIYICLAPNFYLEVPFPNLICKNSKNFKHKSIPCKYKTNKNCYEKQLEFSKIYKTEIRQCNFVHIGEQYIKIGSDYRCPNLPSFGNFETLSEDLNTISLSDIKIILMNSSSDLLLIYLWYANHLNLGEIVFNDLDVFK
jgi:hypothetical protein